MSEPNRAVFLSYASEDAPVAQRICTALRAAGLEVWFDQSELRGGDVWDATIRRQIKTCALFIPILSRASHSRAEGYFRLEWKLAVDRSHLIAADRAFLLPVVVDDTSESDDRVPERFREVQWLRAPGGEPPPDLVDHVARLLARSVVAEPASGPAGSAAARGSAKAPPQEGPATADPPPVGAARRSRLVWIGAAVLLVLAGLGVARYFTHGVALVPYSLEDRRMTFAVLPFDAPAGDAHAALVAKASADLVLANLEANAVWAQTAPRARVESVVRKATAAREIAQALDVHFLVRGTLAPAATGYALSLTLIDGATERALSSSSLAIPPDALVPRWEDDVDAAVFHLMVAGIHAEVARQEGRTEGSLDVRDLTFRAVDYWRSHRGAAAKDGYTSASQLLQLALARAPDDRFATYTTAWINLCDCILAWSTNPDEQRAIGSAAMEKYLRVDPTDVEMLLDKAGVMQLRGRYEEALEVTRSVLQRHPESFGALSVEVVSLVHMGRPREAVPIADGLAQRYPDRYEELTALAADVHYAVGDYAAAAALAQNAAARMSEAALRSPIDGPVRLTLAAAEARLGHVERAKRALEDFAAAVPAVNSIAAVREWMVATDTLAGFEPLYVGLRLAGLHD